MGLKDADARILITVGNVTERKGQDIVVRALPRDPPRGAAAHYVVVGLPTRGEELRELARSSECSTASTCSAGSNRTA